MAHAKLQQRSGGGGLMTAPPSSVVGANAKEEYHDKTYDL
jgi:hypothetical protein